ncbi:MAG: IS110 family RNA-guided transposase, partial [Planctomycetota bacterium]
RFDLTRESLLDFAQHILQPEDHVIVEATLNTWAVVEVLEPHVAEVVVSNPLKTKAVAEARIKTDKVDAHTLAQLLRVDYVAEVWKPDESTRELRRLTRCRAGLVGDRTSAKNRIHSVLSRRLVQPPLQHLFGPSGLLWLRTLELDEEGRMMIDSDLRVIESFDREIALLDDLLVKRAYADPRARLLVTLPGVDLHVAVALLAALGDIHRFPSGAHAASYLGLVPRTKQSAHHCYHGPITKAGNVHARTMLVQACQTLGRNPGPLGVFFRRMKKKKCHNVAVIAAAHKLVTIAWHMLVNGEPYRYAIPASTEAKLARLRTRATGKCRKRGLPKGRQESPSSARTSQATPKSRSDRSMRRRNSHPTASRRPEKKHTSVARNSRASSTGSTGSRSYPERDHQGELPRTQESACTVQRYARALVRRGSRGPSRGRSPR